MTNEDTKYLDDPKVLSGIPFRLKPDNFKEGKLSPKEEWRTDYNYRMNVILKQKGVPMVGYFNDNNEFMTKPRYEKADFKADNYNNYYYDNPEKVGKKANYFKKHILLEVELLRPTTIPLWSKQEKAVVPTQVTDGRLALSRSQYEKLLAELEDPRSKPHDYFVLKYDAKASPALMYSMKFYQEGKPFNGVVLNTPTEVASPPTIKIFPHERALLMEIVGEKTTPETVVEYILTAAPKRDVNMTTERAKEIANSIVRNGVVTL